MVALFSINLKVEEIFPYFHALLAVFPIQLLSPHPGTSCFSMTSLCKESIVLLVAVCGLCFPIWISVLVSFSLMQCQLGVLPLGTGNDLARVLGWGSACDDDTQLPQILEKLERASTKMLDRWVTITNILPAQELCENILPGELGSSWFCPAAGLLTSAS